MAGGTLQSAIDFNNAHADEEMPFFNQDVFDQAQSLAPGPDDPQPVFSGMTYNQALEIDRLSGVNGIDAALKRFNLDAVVSATDNPAWATDLIYGDHFIFGTSGLAAPEGYPIVQVPAGMVFGVPLGISFFGTAFSEPTLIKLASGFEAATRIPGKESADVRANDALQQHSRHDSAEIASQNRSDGAEARRGQEDAAPLVAELAVKQEQLARAAPKAAARENASMIDASHMVPGPSSPARRKELAVRSRTAARTSCGDSWLMSRPAPPEIS